MGGATFFPNWKAPPEGAAEVPSSAFLVAVVVVVVVAAVAGVAAAPPKNALNAGGLYSPVFPPRKLHVLAAGEVVVLVVPLLEVEGLAAAAAVEVVEEEAGVVDVVADFPKDQFVLGVNLKPVPTRGAISEGGFVVEVAAVAGEGVVAEVAVA